MSFSRVGKRALGAWKPVVSVLMIDREARAAERPQQLGPWIVPHEYEVGASRWLSRAIDALRVSLHPILGSVSWEAVQDLPEPESSASSIQADSEVPELASSLFRSVHITHEWVMSVDEVVEFDVEALLHRMYEAADELGGQLTLAMFQHISDICEENGQVVSAADENFFDAFIDAIEKIDLGFDSDGNPTARIAMNPETLAKVSKTPPTPEQVERMKIVIERKREDWLAARRRRELPQLPK